MNYSKKIVSMFICIMIFYSYIYKINSQTLDQSVVNFTQDLARAYVTPLLSGYSADMNSGWIQRIPEAKKFSFNISVGMVFMGSFLNNAETHFSKSANLILTPSEADFLTQSYSGDVKQFLMDQLTNNQVPVNVYGATIVGDANDQVTFDVLPLSFNYNGQQIDLPQTPIPLGFGGIVSNQTLFTMLAPQISIGTFYGTELTFRIIPHFFFANNGLKKSLAYGVGFQHNPFVWFKKKPKFDISIGAFYQHLNIEDVLTTDDFHVGLYAGKTWGKRFLSFSLFGGVSYENSNVNLTYIFNTGNSQLPVSFNIPTQNNIFGTLGLGLKLAIVSLNADFNLSKYSAITVGLNVSY